MMANALNSSRSLRNLTSHGPIRSRAHSSKGIVWISLSGNSPNPLPSEITVKTENQSPYAAVVIFLMYVVI